MRIIKKCKSLSFKGVVEEKKSTALIREPELVGKINVVKTNILSSTYSMHGALTAAGKLGISRAHLYRARVQEIPK